MITFILDETFNIVTEESAEHGDTAESGFICENFALTFRELVEHICNEGFTNASASHYADFVWLSTEPQQDMHDGSYETRNLHWSHKNPARLAKYWRKAMQCAGVKIR